jgi:hypothetical protein
VGLFDYNLWMDIRLPKQALQGNLRWRLRSRFAAILSVVVLVPAALLALLWMHFGATETASKIVDFHPTSFQAKANADFFYSIGDELKNSDELSPQARTLLRGKIENFLVSPDGTKIAVVANGLLVVVGPENPILRDVTSVDSIYRKPKPIGRQFYRDDDFQWSNDSKSLYLIRDEYYESKGSQLFSSKGELWRYDIQTGNLQLVLKPFPAYTYFFGRNSGIYFSVPTPTGDLQLKYYDGNHMTDVDESNVGEIRADRLSHNFVESPFFSFSILDYETIVLPTKGVSLVTNQRGGTQDLKIANKSYLTVTQGEGFKGPYYCSDTLRSVFLPGDRYFLFNVYCGNCDGQLLIDTLTGDYQRLPPDTRVYLTLNTDTIPHYRITGAGIVAGW